MILISVKSEVVTDKRQFKSDNAANSFLKRINKLHHTHRVSIVGKKPLRKHFNKRRIGTKAYRKAVDNWFSSLGNVLPLKVEIINTKHNQINLTL